MTWLELKDFIEKSVVDKNANVVVYDLLTGQEYECDFVELQEDKSWRPTICINHQQLEME